MTPPALARIGLAADCTTVALALLLGGVMRPRDVRAADEMSPSLPALAERAAQLKADAVAPPSFLRPASKAWAAWLDGRTTHGSFTGFRVREILRELAGPATLTIEESPSLDGRVAHVDVAGLTVREALWKVSSAHGVKLGWATTHEPRMFLGALETEGRKAPTGVQTMLPVVWRDAAHYQEMRQRAAIRDETTLDGVLYYATEERRDAPFPDGTSAWYRETQRHKTIIPLDGRSDPSWGETKDGLRLGLSPAGIAVGTNGVFAVRTWFENVGDKPARVPIGTFGKLARVQFGDRSFCLFDRMALLVKRSPQWRDLAPGERYAEEFTVCLLSRAPNGHVFGNPKIELPAETAVAVSLRFGFLPGHPSPSTEADWQDARTLISGVVTVTSPERPIAPAGKATGWSEVNEGLRGRLVIAQPKIPADGWIQATLELENVGRTQLLVRTQNPFDFQARIADAAGKDVLPTSQRTDVLYSEQFASIPVGQRLSLPVTIESLDGAKGSQVDTTTRTWKLPPGNYGLGGSFGVVHTLRLPPRGTWLGHLTLPVVSFEIASLPGKAETDRDGVGKAAERPGERLCWADKKTGRVLFTADDIVRFDWDRQVFELRRDRAMDAMAHLWPHGSLAREFVVRNGADALYEGLCVRNLASWGHDGPAIVVGGEGPRSPLFHIQAGYPGGRGERDDGRFAPRLRAALDKAGVLKAIPPAEIPIPVETISTQWHGTGTLRVRAEVFPETLRLGQEARAHLFFAPGEGSVPAFDAVTVQSSLSQDGRGYFCTTEHAAPPEVVSNGVHVLRWKPWGPVYGAVEPVAKAGPAKISFVVALRKTTAGGLQTVLSLALPEMAVTVLAATARKP